MRPFFLRSGPDRALRRVLDAVDPPRVRRPRLQLAVVALLFAAVTALKVTGVLTPADAPSVLFVAPIAVAAVAFGARGGLAAAVVAIALMGASELRGGGSPRPGGARHARAPSSCSAARRSAS